MDITKVEICKQGRWVYCQLKPLEAFCSLTCFALEPLKSIKVLGPKLVKMCSFLLVKGLSLKCSDVSCEQEYQCMHHKYFNWRIWYFMYPSAFPYFYHKEKELLWFFLYRHLIHSFPVNWCNFLSHIKGFQFLSLQCWYFLHSICTQVWILGWWL